MDGSKHHYFIETAYHMDESFLIGQIRDSCFLGVNVIDGQVSDATAMLKFRHLIEKHHIGEKIFQDVTDHPEYKGKFWKVIPRWVSQG